MQWLENDELKHVDIVTKTISLEHAWIKRLFDQNFHDLKVIPLKLIDNTFFKFGSNLYFDDSSLQPFSKFHKTIFLIYLVLQAVSKHNLCGSIKMLDLLTRL